MSPRHPLSPGFWSGVSTVPQGTDLGRRQWLHRFAQGSVAGMAALPLTAWSGTQTPQPVQRAFNAVQQGKTEYDYIVIGSGAGGGVVAANLALAGHEVLVLEAGNLDGDEQTYKIPAFNLAASAELAMNWNFYVKHYTDPSPAGRGGPWVASEGGILYPRASTIGGCTAHHVMLTLLAEHRDWDDMAKLSGDASWGSYHMRRYDAVVRRWLPVEMTPPSLLLKDAVVTRLVAAAAVETGTLQRAGLTRPNFNTGSAIGAHLLDPNDYGHLDNFREGLYGIAQSTRQGVRRGTRERLFEVMDQHPTRLSIQINALVHRVLMRPPQAGETGWRALGVEFALQPHRYGADPLRSGTRGTPPRHQVRARKEVIVAGGAFNSPQILMLSGVGQRAQLAQHRLPVALDLPGVGENLQDRCELSVVTEYERPLDIVKHCRFGKNPDPCLDEYRSQQLHRTYASNGVIAGIKKRVRGGSQHPELFVFGSPARFDGYAPGFFEKGIERPNYFTWAILRGYNHQNTGYVRLRSADPEQPPDINFRYFRDGTGGEQDIDALIEGIDLARSINRRARQFGWLDQNRDREIFPGPEVKTREQLKALIKARAWGHHASCSNKMGPVQDRMAVVDAQCRVHGTANLRVVDASVFPRIPGLFIVMPIYMMAEKASEAILRDAGKV